MHVWKRQWKMKKRFFIKFLLDLLRLVIWLTSITIDQSSLNIKGAKLEVLRPKRPITSLGFGTSLKNFLYKFEFVKIYWGEFAIFAVEKSVLIVYVSLLCIWALRSDHAVLTVTFCNDRNQGAINKKRPRRMSVRTLI